MRALSKSGFNADFDRFFTVISPTRYDDLWLDHGHQAAAGQATDRGASGHGVYGIAALRTHVRAEGQSRA